MKRENLVIDGCAFTEDGVGFVGVTDQVLRSDVDAFFLTIPSENDGYTACTKAIGGIYNLLDDDKKGIKIARSVDDIYAAKKKGSSPLFWHSKIQIPLKTPWTSCEYSTSWAHGLFRLLTITQVLQAVAAQSL